MIFAKIYCDKKYFFNWQDNICWRFIFCWSCLRQLIKIKQEKAPKLKLSDHINIPATVS